MILAVDAELPHLDFIIRRVRFHSFWHSSHVADALFEAAEVMIGGIKRMLRVSRFVISLLDIARFLAVQETDDQLVNR